MKKTKKQVRDELNLDQLPDDEFMDLLEEVGEGPLVSGPQVEEASEYTPAQIVGELAEARIEGEIGALIARAREQAHMSLRQAGEAAGVSHGRIQQLEKSTNIEVATLVRVANTLGYRVSIRLTPTEADRQPLVAELHLAQA